MADVLFSSSERDKRDRRRHFYVLPVPPPSGRKKQTAMNMGAKDSVTPPLIVKTPKPPALRSENVVAMRNPPPKVGKVPPAQCM